MQSNHPSYTAPPFPAFPCTSRYVPLGSVKEAYTRVCGSIDACETISLIVGPPGTGKSLICRLLAERYATDFDVVTLGETPIESRHELLTHLIHQLHLESRPGVDPQMTLVDFLSSDQAAAGGLLMLVDEAQSLSVEVIEAIRMVTNIMRRGEPCVVAVLLGGVKLDEILVDSSLDAFTQRIATRCYLHPMTADETRQYICDTIQACGSEPGETITSEAIAAIHHACSGIPRLINQMITQAIECAAAEDQVLIGEQIIDQAWAQLQQLPSPIIDATKVVSKSAPIEFGELDEAIEYETIEHTTLDDHESVDDREPADDPASVASSTYETTTDETPASGEITTEVRYIEVDTSVAAGAEIYFGGDDRGDEVVAIQTMEDLYQNPISGHDLSPHRDLVLQSENDHVEMEPTQPVAPAICPQDLFGDFEEEEEIAVGRRFGDTAIPSASVEAVDVSPHLSNDAALSNDATFPVETSNLEPAEPGDLGKTIGFDDTPAGDASTELEEMLHQEIVGISQMADSLMTDATCESSTQATEVPQWSQWNEVTDSKESLETSSGEVSSDSFEDLRDSNGQQGGESPALWIAKSESEAGGSGLDDGATDNSVINDGLSNDKEEDIELSRDDSDMLVIEDELELRRVDPAARRDSHNKTISVDFEAMLARMRSANQ